MAIAAFLVTCVWSLPLSRNKVASQDFRFLLRGISFCSISTMIMHQYDEIPSLVSFAAYCSHVWAWFMVSVHPVNFRVLSMTVSLMNLIANGHSSTLLTQACSQVVLLGLLMLLSSGATGALDVRMQRLLCPKT